MTEKGRRVGSVDDRKTQTHRATETGSYRQTDKSTDKRRHRAREIDTKTEKVTHPKTGLVT